MEIVAGLRALLRGQRRSESDSGCSGSPIRSSDSECVLDPETEAGRWISNLKSFQE